jgi:cyclin-dependent kinase 8/11
MRNTPEYHNVKRLDEYVPFYLSGMLAHNQLIVSSPNRLDSWCKQRSLPPTAINFLSKLFLYDPDKRMNARDALSHSWFQEDPQPTYKSVWLVSLVL